jgi:hypothetical protein
MSLFEYETREYSRTVASLGYHEYQLSYNEFEEAMSGLEEATAKSESGDSLDSLFEDDEGQADRPSNAAVPEKTDEQLQEEDADFDQRLYASLLAELSNNAQYHTDFINFQEPASESSAAPLSEPASESAPAPLSNSVSPQLTAMPHTMKISEILDESSSETAHSTVNSVSEQAVHEVAPMTAATFTPTAEVSHETDQTAINGTPQHPAYEVSHSTATSASAPASEASYKSSYSVGEHMSAAVKTSPYSVRERASEAVYQSPYSPREYTPEVVTPSPQRVYRHPSVTAFAPTPESTTSYDDVSQYDDMPAQAESSWFPEWSLDMKTISSFFGLSKGGQVYLPVTVIEMGDGSVSIAPPSQEVFIQAVRIHRGNVEATAMPAQTTSSWYPNYSLDMKTTSSFFSLSKGDQIFLPVTVIEMGNGSVSVAPPSQDIFVQALRARQGRAEAAAAQRARQANNVNAMQRQPMQAQHPSQGSSVGSSSSSSSATPTHDQLIAQLEKVDHRRKALCAQVAANAQQNAGIFNNTARPTQSFAAPAANMTARGPAQQRSASNPSNVVDTWDNRAPRAPVNTASRKRPAVIDLTNNNEGPKRFRSLTDGSVMAPLPIPPFANKVYQGMKVIEKGQCVLPAMGAKVPRVKSLGENRQQEAFEIAARKGQEKAAKEAQKAAQKAQRQASKKK